MWVSEAANEGVKGDGEMLGADSGENVKTMGFVLCDMNIVVAFDVCSGEGNAEHNESGYFCRNGGEIADKFNWIITFDSMRPTETGKEQEFSRRRETPKPVTLVG